MAIEINSVNPVLQVRHRKTGEVQNHPLLGSHYIIGRDPDCDIVLESKSVSRKHIEIINASKAGKGNNDFYIRDLKSNNGTFLNEIRLTPQEKMPLKYGDQLRIEDFEIHFLATSDKKVSHEATDSDVLEVKMVKKLLQAMNEGQTAMMEVMDGDHKGEKFAFEGKNQDVLIGRDSACEFFINETILSRKHAKISKRFDTFTIYDLGSKNGTFINRESIQEKALKDGDIIQLGTVTILFKNPQDVGFDLDPPPRREIPEAVVSIPEAVQVKEEPEISLPASRSSKRSDAAPVPAPDEPQQSEPSPESNYASPDNNDAYGDPNASPMTEENAQALPPDGEWQQAPTGMSRKDKIILGVGVAILVGSLIGLFWML